MTVSGREAEPMICAADGLPDSEHGPAVDEDTAGHGPWYSEADWERINPAGREAEEAATHRTKFREPWFLSNDNDLEEWLITDGVATFAIDRATDVEFGLAVQGTIERALVSERTTRETAWDEGAEAMIAHRRMHAATGDTCPLPKNPYRAVPNPTESGDPIANHNAAVHEPETAAPTEEQR